MVRYRPVGSSLVRARACCHPGVGASATVPGVTGPHVLPFLPLYIPADVDIHQVLADVGDDGVSAPAADVAGLRQVVAHARAEGIDLKVVAIPNNPPIDTPLRDIATDVGLAYPGSTVLAVSPSYAGTYSRDYDRITLEAGQDVAKTGDPVQSAKNFLGELTMQHFPWTTLTIVLTILVAVATVATRMLQIRAKRELPEPAPADA